MLIKHLLPKCSSLLGSQGKNYAPLWRYTVRRYGRTDSSGSDDSLASEEKWHQEQLTCRAETDHPHSPIDIDTSKVVPREYLPLKFSLYDFAGVRMVLQNNGTVLKIDIGNGEPHVTGGGMIELYRANHVHFHWGSDSTRGSEHTIDGQHFPMEMHIVHFNRKYPNIVDASKKAVGLSVLAFMFEISNKPNEALKPITFMVNEVKQPYTWVPIELPNLMSILPQNLSTFYHYTDDNKRFAHPTISWTIFKDTIKISESQIASFRRLNSQEMDPKTKKLKPMVDNNRPTNSSINPRVFTDENDPRRRRFDDSPDTKKKRKSLSEKMFKGLKIKK
ncbi:hypothetical protein BsWGS_07490 [Bradybaena similaris]